MKRKIFSFLQYSFFLGLGIFLVWWQFHQMSEAQKIQFVESLRHANYWLILPVIIMSILSHISRAMRWKLLIESMGYNPSTLNAFYSVMSGYVANTFVPRAGEILKCSLLGKYEKIPVNKLIGTILVERAFDFICYLVLILITVLIQVNLLWSFITEKFAKADQHAFIPLWLKIIAIILIFLLLLLTLRWSFKRYSEKKMVQRIRGLASGLKEGFNTIAHLKKGHYLLRILFLSGSCTCSRSILVFPRLRQLLTSILKKPAVY